MAHGAIPVKRGCGTRQKGGIYAEVGVSDDGAPIESFLLDPPIRVSVEQLGLSYVGVSIVEREGLFHAFDWVGETFYPNVADFVEEGRRFGISRRISKSVDMSSLTPKSRLIVVHRKAWINQRGKEWNDWKIVHGVMGDAGCPTEQPTHVGGTDEQMCVAYWWQDIERGAGEFQLYTASDRLGKRKMPSFEYEAALSPEGVVQEYQPALFATFPIHRLAVVYDDEGGRHEAALKAAKKSGLPVDLESE